jgi:hypothetical protein
MHGFKNLPLLKGMFIPYSYLSLHMGQSRRPTRSQRLAEMYIPWALEVVKLDEIVTAREIIRRIADTNGPIQRIGARQSEGTYRNLKHLPNVQGMNFILKVSPCFVKHGTSSPIEWRRIQ